MPKATREDRLHKAWLNNARTLLYQYFRQRAAQLRAVEEVKEVEAPTREVFVSAGLNSAVAFGSLAVEELKKKSYLGIIKERLTTLFGMNYGYFSEEVKELAMSTKPVETGAVFSRAVKAAVDLSPYTLPFGPRAPLKSLQLFDNPKIPRKVDSLANERIKARVALYELYDRAYDPYYLQRTFSVGIFGVEKRLVPTRQAITAVDSLLANKNVDMLRDLPTLDEYELYYYEHLHNRYICVLLPEAWQFENIESWPPKRGCNTSNHYRVSVEWEPNKGRWQYAESQAGAYYAVKFAVSEFLAKQRRRQAAALCIREISPDYAVPVGVWQVREGVREALKKGAVAKADSKQAMLKQLERLIELPLKAYIKKSVILKQRKLTDWLT